MTVPTEHPASPPAAPPVLLGSARGGRGWTVLALVEVVLAALVVVRDLLIPSLVLLAMAGLSLLVRREGPATLGLVRLHRFGRLLRQVAALTVAWTVIQIAVILPVLEHATGERQDVSEFEELHHHLPLLLVLLVLSWTLAAFGEEIAFRGYLSARLQDVLGNSTRAVVVTVLVSSALFGLIHTEQGMVGVAATFADAIFFSVLRIRSASGLWAAILAHGLNNTIGLTTYFLVGPVHGLW